MREPTPVPCSLPLARLYFLRPAADSTRIAIVEREASSSQLLLGSRCLSYLRSRGLLQRHVDTCAAVDESVRLYDVVLPTSLPGTRCRGPSPRTLRGARRSPSALRSSEDGGRPSTKKRRPRTPHKGVLSDRALRCMWPSLKGGKRAFPLGFPGNRRLPGAVPRVVCAWPAPPTAPGRGRPGTPVLTEYEKNGPPPTGRQAGLACVSTFQTGFDQVSTRLWMTRLDGSSGVRGLFHAFTHSFE